MPNTCLLGNLHVLVPMTGHQPFLSVVQTVAVDLPWKALAPLPWVPLSVLHPHVCFFPLIRTLPPTIYFSENYAHMQKCSERNSGICVSYTWLSWIENHKSFNWTSFSSWYNPESSDHGCVLGFLSLIKSCSLSYLYLKSIFRLQMETLSTGNWWIKSVQDQAVHHFPDKGSIAICFVHCPTVPKCLWLQYEDIKGLCWRNYAPESMLWVASTTDPSPHAACSSMNAAHES